MCPDADLLEGGKEEEKKNSNSREMSVEKESVESNPLPAKSQQNKLNSLKSLFKNSLTVRSGKS